MFFRQVNMAVLSQVLGEIEGELGAQHLFQLLGENRVIGPQVFQAQSDKGCISAFVAILTSIFGSFPSGRQNFGQCTLQVCQKLRFADLCGFAMAV